MNQKLSVSTYFNELKKFKEPFNVIFFEKDCRNRCRSFLQYQANFLTHARTYDTAPWGAIFCHEDRAVLKSARKLLSIDIEITMLKKRIGFEIFWILTRMRVKMLSPEHFKRFIFFNFKRC